MEREARNPEHCREPVLESALARGLHRIQYEGLGDVMALGAWLCTDLARSHSFTDGNKRTALAVLALFLDHNGWALRQRGRIDVAAHLVKTIEQYQVSRDAGSSAVMDLESLIRRRTERMGG